MKNFEIFKYFLWTKQSLIYGRKYCSLISVKWLTNSFDKFKPTMEHIRGTEKTIP